MPPLQVLRALESSLRGLEESVAAARLAHYGDNVVRPARASGWPAQLLTAVTSPFVLILLFLDAASLISRDLAGLGVITAMAMVSCTLHLTQVYRADKAAAALRAMVSTTATALRRATPQAAPVAREVPTEHLVPGDVVRLAAGDIVPADLRLLRSADLRVSQALVTGESLPVLKYATLSAAPNGSRRSPEAEPTVFDCPQLCLLGSSVVGGSATAVVVATGSATYFGAASGDPRHARGETTFDRGVKGVSWALIRFILAAVPAVLVINGLARGDWLQAFLFAVSVAVGLTPEMLPVVVTTALARGATMMSRHGVIVKRLPAIHNLGAMDVLCTDKTGTLTQDRISLACHLDPAGQPDVEVLRWACRGSHFGVEHAGEIVGDPLDEALLRHAEQIDLSVDGGYRCVDAVTFEAVRRRATVVLRRTGQPGVDLLVTKGAVEEVLSCCTRVRLGGCDQALDARQGKRLRELADTLHAEGVRVLAVALKTQPAGTRGYRAADECAMTLIGFVGLLDEAKSDASDALRDLAGRGVQVKMITGDHPLVAARICRDAGLEPGRPVPGDDLDLLDDAALTALAEHTTVFARVDPQQKARVVSALRAGGHTVGYLGDGVNDAPALRAADVGICVEAGVDVARESSDVLLVRKDLATLTGAAIGARRSFANIIKYVKITVSSNVGNVCSVLAASVVLPFLPMLPLQLLIQNLLFDAAALSLAFDRTDQSAQQRPRSFDSADLIRFVVCFGAINSLADLATFAVLWHTLGAHASASTQVLFHTGWFVENLLTQALAVHLLRSRAGLSGWSWAARPVLITTIAIAVISLVTPFSPLGPVLGLRALPAAYYGWLAAVLAAFCVATLTGKSIYRRRLHSWL
jgi:Mg2+-importing ATPase